MSSTVLSSRQQSSPAPSWLDYIIANTSINETETNETIFLDGENKIGVSSEIIFKGTIYKRFDLIDDSQSYILSTTNAIIKKRF
jgi:hypothetical protein